ncbi:DnaJ domain-containing protein [Malonomonas rubra DSM 5091]|uniref:DnaJ domain-containing protein n=1 Tax=Malonomonas rubra DSM 5091 TaxID=1122189 RepID=A0A1M6JFM1_MALRU|nr:J domain-containing protein [Malonomonas rubra]SHJ45517.1 DnaJ domain-containing protein [Malonomonas rubra DSM 5091]
MKISHYQILGIPENADLRQVKAAYRSMAKRFHPDTNSGSEAAAELFRQLSEAYRVLSDEQLRKAYDRTLTPPQPAPAKEKAQTGKKAAPKQDPQQKFNKFLHSLLDAIFEEPDPPPGRPAQARASPHKRGQHKPRDKPDFNFYYYLEIERSNSPYSCGEDGIYRRSKPQAKNKPKFSRVPGSSFVCLLLLVLLQFFKH